MRDFKTPKQIYGSSVERITNNITDLMGFYHNHIEEIDECMCNLTSERVEIKTHEHINIDGRRYWELRSVWFDDKPIMVVQNAGRDGDDRAVRFITDEEGYKEMISHLNYLSIRVDKSYGVDDQIEGLDSFYGRTLGDNR